MAFKSVTEQQGYGRYGSYMGRYTGPYYLDTSAGKLYLQRVLLDRGGYDQGGAYWGFGAPLWEVQDQDGNTTILRAASRERAKEVIRQDFPNATFFR